ncbi:hypothetical protein D0T23_26435 [Duganella sp. BJB475]|nr:hypothetical protein D0T23_26435 [Duganella sp. BJB475]RFP25285.1 hypothetical protein D0T21_27465 [Duganella sp. BJB476]
MLDNLEKLDQVPRIQTRDCQIAAVARHKLTLYYHDRLGSFNDAVVDHRHYRHALRPTLISV